jgi:hypothetical protein
VIFGEPMVAKSYLEAKPEFRAELPAPAAGRGAGLYPRGYRVRWDAARGEYHVTLTGLSPQR